MATFTGETGARIKAIEGGKIVSGGMEGGTMLYLVKQDQSVVEVDLVNGVWPADIKSGAVNASGELILTKNNDTTINCGVVGGSGGGGGVNPSSSGLFSSYRNTALILPNLSKSNVPMNGTNFNLNGWFDTTTGRYTPKVEGFYRLSVGVSLKTMFPQNTDSRVILYMLAGISKMLHTMHPQGEWNILSSTIIVAANGTTDYFIPQLHVSHSTDVELRTANADGTYFQGELISAVPIGFASN